MLLKDTNRYIMPGTHRLHIATIYHNGNDYICFLIGGKIYIEKDSGGTDTEFIFDDVLAQGLYDFLYLHKVLDGATPVLPDNKWLKLGSGSPKIYSV